MQIRRGSQRIRAFTLLEMLLTLSLSVVLIILVSGALQFYGRDMNVRDMDIRQTLLAVAVMQMIEDDLRATLHSEPIDTSALEAVLASTGAAMEGATGGAQPAGGSEEDLSAAGIESSESTETVPAEASTLDLQTGAAVLQTPGLIGNQYQIQIDMSRLPRLEEYVAMLDGSAADIEDIPSDIKTVAYYVQDDGMIGGIQDPLDVLDGGSSSSEANGGLVRRSLDRAATVYAALNGNLTTLNQTGELLAPEIKGIEFSYWDGTTWLLEWSSDEYGELPLAVQVRLYMSDPRVEVLDPTVQPGTAVRTFDHIVRLPMAKPVEDEEAELTGTGI